MADNLEIQILLDNLNELLHHDKLIAGAEGDVCRLKDYLEYFNSFLKYVSIKKVKNDYLTEFVRQIRDVVYDLQDVVEPFIIQVMARKSKYLLRRLCSTRTVKLEDIERIASKVERVRREIWNVFGDKFRLDLMLLEIEDVRPKVEKLEVSRERRANVIGFDDDAAKIIGYLCEATERLDVISIVGMPGLGKTTLAKKVFEDPRIQYEFPKRLWVDVSNFTPKDLSFSILRKLTTITKEMDSMREHELVVEVSCRLEREKFLIVLDDVWTSEDWSMISDFFPTSSHRSKILITTRFFNVAISANRHRVPLMLRFLNPDESSELLKYEVFGESNCEPELEVFEKLIAYKCNGLPLLVKIIGGILVQNLSTIDKGGRRKAWKEVCERFTEYIMDDPERMIEKTISLSYEQLPFHLRACLLYLAMFPADIEIPVWKLFRMWIAEGFIQETLDLSLEEVAESYLDDLINRNLVIVGKHSSEGRVKTCRIHDSIKSFCIWEVEHNMEYFFNEIRKCYDGTLEPVIKEPNKYRRLCIHSNILEFTSSKPSGPRVRSFVCFSKEDITLQGDHLSAIPTGFKLLRVLDVKPIKFTKIPSQMYDLLHLRYIHLSFNLSILPSQFAKLWNLQTLIVDTTKPTLTLRANIWKMRHLRHLKTNVATSLPEPSSIDTESKNIIQTLGTISPQSCTDKVFKTAYNTKEISIRGPLELLFTSTITGSSFDNIMMLVKLEKLKLQNDVFPQLPCVAPLPFLPPSVKFPPNLRKFTLSATYLKWSDMRVLACLENLEVLKLKDNAFTGNYWETHDGGFRRLKVLSIGDTDLTVWNVSAHHFPALVHLELLHCEKLRDVPFEFAKIKSLAVLLLKNCPAAVVSAYTIKEQKTLEAKVDNCIEFNLSILP